MRAIDAEVAEKVLGWKSRRISNDFDDWVLCEYQKQADRLAGGQFCGALQLVPKFTTDPAADFLVLDHVRKYWSISQQSRFRELIKEYGSMINYRPGLWSRTALKIVQGPLMGALLSSRVAEDRS